VGVITDFAELRLAAPGPGPEVAGG